MNNISTNVQVDELLYDLKKQNAKFFISFLLVYEMSAYIANDMIMPGMLQVISSFNAPESYVTTSLTAFILGGSSLQIILGPLSDRYGRRPVMLAGVFLFLICTILITFSQSITVFILMRFFQGMGLCFISVVGYAVLQEIFNDVSAVRLTSIMNNVSILAPLAGPLLGSLIILAYDWRVIFYFIAFTTSIALLGIWFYMPETVGTKKLDGSFVNLTPLSLAVIKKNYLALLRHRRFMLSSIIFALANVPIIAWIGTSPVILMKAAKLNVITYAFCQIPIFLAAILGNFYMRHVSQKMSLRAMTNYGSFMLAICLMLMGIVSLINSTYYILIIGMSLYSFALGFISAPLNRIALFAALVPKGTTAAMISIILMVITALGNQLSGWVYTNHHNEYYALFCAMIGILFFCIYFLFKKA